ncbi:ATP-binding protein [Winogradskyella forsetii]|uniref:ATP-binding protein n=1 Tax=Winogradskyella forsetii TaxID=2686077 RepID=UPI0015C80594|nr:ATP-binding protein [Winogradskyella forsetii]
MAKIPFKVSARTAKLIGLENFSNAEGAIIELIKNTYDADAKICIAVYDLVYVKDENDVEKLDKDNSSIYVIDNGVGMTDNIITNQWMTIGTDDKLYSHTSDGGRVKTGAKGIGRFALNRLGTTTELYTISEETKEGQYWKVEWNDFDKAGAVVSQINADLIEKPELDLKALLAKKFKDNNQIAQLIENNSFEKGTVIKITNLNDNWEFDQLQRLFGNLEMLLPPKEQNDFELHFFSMSNTEDFGQVKGAYYDDFDYKISARYLDDEDKTLIVDITRNELDVNVIENRYKELFDYDKMKSFPFRLEDIKAKTIQLKTTLSEVFSSDVDSDLIEKIGKFSFTFYFLKNTISDDKQDGDIKKYPYKNFNSSNRRAWLKKFGGVKIFRDDFRIRPYGEKGEDWLKLGERQAQSPGGAGQKLGGYRIRPNQVAGTINISRIHNESFQDKSGREGIRENDVFDLFKNLLIEIIGFFENDRNTIMFHLSELSKKRNKEEEAKRKAKEEADRINKEQEEEEQRKRDAEADSDKQPEDSNQTPEEEPEPEEKPKDGATETEKSLAKGVKILSQEIEDKDEEIRLLRNFASVGLIISSFAHEVKSLRSRLIPRTSFLLKELAIHLDEKDLKHLDKDDNPFYMIKLIQEEDTKLKHWLEYSLNSLTRDKRERSNLNFGRYFESFKANWKKALEQRNVSIALNGNKDDENVIRAFEVDMDSIFNNLLSNSLNALKGSKKEKKLIEISWKRLGNRIEILFSDNGKGLDQQYRNSPEDIFKLLESSKKDKKGEVIGTGLGLYIVQSIIDGYNNSSVSIMNIEDGLALKIEFQVRKDS